MYIQIGTTSYTKLRNVSFSPEISAAATSLPIGEFSADILTTDTISVGGFATMIGRDDIHFARFWIVYAEKIAPGVVRIRAQSRLCLLDRRTLPAVMYSDIMATMEDVVQAMFQDLGETEYSYPDGWGAIQASGFFPEQTARERLLWFCLVTGTYVRTFGDTNTEEDEMGEPPERDFIEITPISETPKLVPENVTFWRPTLNYKDHVTAVKVWAYSFDERSPQSGEASVTDGTDTWVVTKAAYTLTNTNVPATAPENVIEVDISAVTEDNVDDVLSHLAKYYFPRMEVEFDCINNGEFWPGDKLQVFDGMGHVVSGYAERADFSFGVQSRSKIRLTAADSADAATLIITYQWDGATLATKTYHFPVGYTYTVQNPYLDIVAGRYRYIFRPVNASVTGTMTAGTNTSTQQCEVALKLDTKTKILEIISVDAVEVQEKTVDGETVNVGVIS